MIIDVDMLSHQLKMASMTVGTKGAAEAMKAKGKAPKEYVVFLASDSF